MSPSDCIQLRSRRAPSFRHEQLLWINEPGNDLIPPLERSQLWAGLVHTIRQPQEVDCTLDASRVVEVTRWQWKRHSSRGGTVVVDRIDFKPESSISVTIEEGPFAGSHSEISIEEPEPGALLVRIVHEVHGPRVPLSPEEESARKAAYDSMNVERISCARSVALSTRYSRSLDS
jgi:hypothetical protein